MDENTAARKNMPHRLRRLTEVWSPRGRPLFFVTFCTADRSPWLADMDVAADFRSFSVRSPELAQVWVGCFVLMPDHVHAFVSAEGSRTLSRWVGSLKGFLSHRKQVQGISSAGWQPGFFDHVLRGSESYSQKWAYVQMNPVRAGLVDKPDDWPYAGEIHKIQW